jgi:hypothetical protein
VYIKHAVQTSDPRVDGLGNPLDYLTEDYFQLGVRQGTEAVSPTKPTWNTDEVSICMVLLTYGQTQIYNSNISHDVWSQDRLDGDVLTAGRYINYPIRFSSSMKGGLDYLIDFNNGRVFDLHVLDFDGDTSEINAIDQIEMVDAGSQINTKRGTIRLNDSAGGLGGDIFMETGDIQKANRIRAAEPGLSTGFQYIEAGGGGSETGVATNPEKWFQLPFSSIHAGSNNFNDPYQGAAIADMSWYKSDYNNTTGAPPNTSNIPGWRVKLKTTIAGLYYTYPLFIDLSTVHSPVRMRRFEIDFRLLAAMGSFQRMQAYLVELNGTTWNAIQSPTDGSESIQFTTLGDDTYGIDTNFTFDSENYNYMIVLTLSTTAIVDTLFVHVTGARIKYEIREASHWY